MQGQGSIELKHLKSVLQDNSYKQWMFRISPKTGTKLKLKSSPIVLTVSHFATCKEFQKSVQKFSKNKELAHSTSLLTPSGSIFSGGSKGGVRLAPPPISRLNWGPKGLRKIFETGPSPGNPLPYLRVWMTGHPPSSPPPPLSEGPDPPLIWSTSKIRDPGKREMWKFSAKAVMISILWRRLVLLEWDSRNKGVNNGGRGTRSKEELGRPSKYFVGLQQSAETLIASSPQSIETFCHVFYSVNHMI